MYAPDFPDASFDIAHAHKSFDRPFLTMRHTTYPKPLGVHAKAIIASLVPLAFAVLFSWLFPLSIVTLSRVDPQRVDGQVEQRLLGVFPILRTEIHDLRGAFVFEDEANNRSSSGRSSQSMYHIRLVDAEGRETLTPANRGTVHDVTSRMRTFIEGSPDPTLMQWTMPLLGYAAAIPALVSLVFVPLVLLDLFRSLLSVRHRDSRRA